MKKALLPKTVLFLYHNKEWFENAYCDQKRYPMLKPNVLNP